MPVVPDSRTVSRGMGHDDDPGLAFCALRDREERARRYKRVDHSLRVRSEEIVVVHHFVELVIAIRALEREPFENCAVCNVVNCLRRPSDNGLDALERRRDRYPEIDESVMGVVVPVPDNVPLSFLPPNGKQLVQHGRLVVAQPFDLRGMRHFVHQSILAFLPGLRLLVMTPQ